MQLAMMVSVTWNVAVAVPFEYVAAPVMAGAEAARALGMVGEAPQRGGSHQRRIAAAEHRHLRRRRGPSRAPFPYH